MAVATKGTTIQIDDGTGTFNTITGAKDFTGPSGSISIMDTTALEDTTKQKLAGLSDEGQFSFNINWNSADTQHILLRTNFIGEISSNFKLNLSNSGVVTFSGYVSGFDHGASVDDVYTAAITIEITGAVTIA